MRIACRGIFILLALTSVAWSDTVSIVPFKDNTLYERDGTSNGMGSYLFAGRTGELENWTRRALMAFDVAGSLPVGATVVMVTLDVNVSRTSSNSQVRFDLHRVLSDWGESESKSIGEGGQGAPATDGDATWSQAFFPDMPWNTAGGDFVAAPSATIQVSGRGRYTWQSTAELVADVQFWLDTPASNFGWIVIGDEEVERSSRRFDSRNHTDSNVWPRLTIEFTALQTLAGDFNQDGALDAADIDALSDEVLAGTHRPEFDLNGDQQVNDTDRQVWIIDLKRTYLGDSDLDQVFSSGDLVTVFAAGEYEDGLPGNSRWSTGDWTGDREFDTGDFVAAFQAGGYELGPRAAAAAVLIPEPSSWRFALVSFVVAEFARYRSRIRKNLAM